MQWAQARFLLKVQRKTFVPGAALVSQLLLRREGCKHPLPQLQRAALMVAANLSLRRLRRTFIRR
jgi:hypothetical protein